MINVKTAVACRDSNGIPSLYFSVVECTLEDYDEGEHYIVATWNAELAGYEVPLNGIVFDQNDYPELMTLHNWEE